MEKPHKQLEVWKKSMELVKKIYSVAAELPDSERFVLSYQIRKSAISIPSNIAEGAARSGRAEFRNFVNIAIGSSSELDTQLELCQLLDYISVETLDPINELLNEIDRMLLGLRNSLKDN